MPFNGYSFGRVMRALAQSIFNAPDFGESVVHPTHFYYLIDNDGSHIVDSDGDRLIEEI